MTSEGGILDIIYAHISHVLCPRFDTKRVYVDFDDTDRVHFHKVNGSLYYIS